METPVEAQEPPPIVNISAEVPPSADEPTPAQLESVPSGESPPARPRTDRQNFFAMDFREVDRDLMDIQRGAANIDHLKRSPKGSRLLLEDSALDAGMNLFQWRMNAVDGAKGLAYGI